MQNLLTKAPIKKQSVIDALEKEIRKGTLEPGARMYGMRDLAKKFNVSFAVINAAYNTLVQKKLIIRQARKGTFVNPNLKYNGTKLVALLTSYHKQDIEGYFEPLFEAANSANIIPIITTLDYKKDWQASISKVMAREPDALMIDVEARCFPMQKICKLIEDTPHCFVNRWEWDKLEPSDAVIIDYASAYGKALKYLKDRGHKKILVVAYRIKVLAFMEKLLNEAAEIAGMSFGNELIYYSYEQLNKSENSLRTIYDQHKPTAVFGLSDYLVQEAIEKGIKLCPEIFNLDKIGFYDLKYSDIPGHEFPTMKINFGKMWKKAFNMLNHNDISVYKVVPELIQR